MVVCQKLMAITKWQKILLTHNLDGDGFHVNDANSGHFGLICAGDFIAVRETFMSARMFIRYQGIARHTYMYTS